MNFEAAAKLPKSIRFGTSTWTYPGWKGQIYHNEYKSEKEFNSRSLAEYVKFPWFRTVGIDSTFYNPPSEKTLTSYADMVGDDFLWVSKVWERITIPRYPSHPRYGKVAGSENPDFLSPQVFVDRVLAPYRAVTDRTGPFVFQFPTIAKGILTADAFFSRLETFLTRLPSEFRYAFEIRNPEYLVSDYFGILNRSGATHCFNHWDRMPGLKAQMKAAADAGGLQSDFYVARILTPKGVSYESAVELFSPYNELKRPNPEMREDVVRLVKRSLETNRSAFIIVNNRAEGNAPLTIDAIGSMAVEMLENGI